MVARRRKAATQLVTLVASRRDGTNKDYTSGTTEGSIRPSAKNDDYEQRTPLRPSGNTTSDIIVTTSVTTITSDTVF